MVPARRRAVGAIVRTERAADGSPVVRRSDHEIAAAQNISRQHALFMLRWLGRPPEDFLTGPVVDIGGTQLPEADSGRRLRWDLAQLHAAVDAQRRSRDLRWAGLAELVEYTPSRLTNLRTAVCGHRPCHEHHPVVERAGRHLHPSRPVVSTGRYR